MTLLADRRSVLAGLGLLGLGACRDPEARVDPPMPEAPAKPSLDLSDLEAQSGGRIGLHAIAADQVSWRGDERFLYCSTFKLFLAAAMQEKAQRRNETLTREIPITAADMIPHAPVTGQAVGKSMTLSALMQATVEVSDNPAANILIRELGGLGALRAWYRTIGDETTRVDRLEPELNRKDGDKDTAQPRQTAINLKWMEETYQPFGLASQYKALWTWMINSPTGPGRIQAGVPDGWTVAHKTGTGGQGQINDIGVLYPPAGRPISIAVFFDGPEGLDAAAGEAVIAEATRRAVTALGRIT